MIVIPDCSRPKPNASAMITGSALPWLPRSGLAKASLVDVRCDRTHNFSTSSGVMPGPLSATLMVVPSIAIVTSGATPASSQASRALSTSSLTVARSQ